MPEQQNKYTRCQNCSEVYLEKLRKCPKCGNNQKINEDLNKPIEEVFNICD